MLELAFETSELFYVNKLFTARNFVLFFIIMVLRVIQQQIDLYMLIDHL